MAGMAEILEENARLRALLQQRDETLELERQAWAQQQEKQEVMLAALRTRAEELARALELIRLKQAGPASERFVPSEQQPLPFLSEVAPPPRAPLIDGREAPEPEVPKNTESKGQPKRRRWAERTDLARRPVRCVASEESCVRCGGKLAVIGQATSYRVDWVPGHFVIDEVVRDKCACPACPGEGVLTVPAPYALPKALCGNGLLARVLVDKFVDHLPLNRQVTRMEREGFETSTSTLSGWVANSAGLLSIVARAIRHELLQQSSLLGDDTGLPVQDGSDGQLRKGRLWAFTDQQQVWYAFSPSKHGEHPVKLLEGYQGHLVLVDGGSEFNQAVRDLKLTRAGCWSHLRRYFFEARPHHPYEVELALGTIRDLFLLERELRGRRPEKVRQARQERAKPLVDGLFSWITELSTTMRPSSKLAEAITYARNQEAALRVFLEHGELPLHNNLSELMLRQPVVGRKNWLFAGSEGGAQAACTLFTLVGSCLLQGIDPYAYLVDVLGRLPDHPANRVHELTPQAWRLAPAQSFQPTTTG
jgi:transposase